MQDPRTGQPRTPGSTLSLSNVLSSLKVDVQCTMHNSGNDAFMCLFALQKLLDPENTALPEMKGKNRKSASRGGSASPMYPSPPLSVKPGQSYSAQAAAAPKPIVTSRSYSGAVGKAQSNGLLVPGDDFGQTRRSPKQLSLRDRKSSAVSNGGGKRSSVAVGITEG